MLLQSLPCMSFSNVAVGAWSSVVHTLGVFSEGCYESNSIFPGVGLAGISMVELEFLLCKLASLQTLSLCVTNSSRIVHSPGLLQILWRIAWSALHCCISLILWSFNHIHSVCRQAWLNINISGKELVSGNIDNWADMRTKNSSSTETDFLICIKYICSFINWQSRTSALVYWF